MRCFDRAAISFQAALVSALVALPATGAVTVYFDIDNANLSGSSVPTKSNLTQAAFAAAAGALGTQGFESFAVGAVPASFPVGGTTASFSSSATVESRIANGLSSFTTFPISGSQFLYSESQNGTTYYTVTSTSRCARSAST